MQVTRDEIAASIGRGEGRMLEFKQGLARDEKIGRTLCAFANTRGGLLLVGVGDRGERLGAPRPVETASRLHAVAARSLEPALAVVTGEVELASRRIVWCSVPLSPSRPHALVHDDGSREIVVRVGSRNRTATARELARIESERTAVPTDPELARDVLAWVAQRSGSDTTVALFLASHAAGAQRVRRAFDELELAGRLVAHRAGSARTYALPRG